MLLAKEGPPVTGLRAQTFASKSHAANAGPQPMQSAGRSSSQLQAREPNEESVGTGGGGLGMSQPSGRQPSRSVVVLCSQVEVAANHVSMRSPHAHPHSAASSEYRKMNRYQQ